MYSRNHNGGRVAKGPAATLNTAASETNKPEAHVTSLTRRLVISDSFGLKGIIYGVYRRRMDIITFAFNFWIQMR